ncbi:MAG: Crp/Fnr family transcriptional regulator [Candidatus Eremiobacteraeota bacterium]|nr:Crp/Fnr family transcriptional regulator [Candidatus Eremiobacteraeota bacterium]MBC5801464.1 Crp/Fnr family transcriptional regulator [Candidatus Eremiobacteraeota bacterium]MBC5820816.1 Crp/Fnr family transcriptional regulator [Candidatus Eremiobacteraeota bacterium]
MTMFPAELRRPLGKGAQVFAQGDAVTSISLVQSGAISLTRCNADGKEINVAFLGAGDFFGEEALFGRPLRDTTAICIGAGTIFVVSPELFGAEVRSDPGLPMRLASNLSLRFDQVTQTVEDLAFANVEARLLMLFDRLANRYGIAHSDGVAVRLRLTHAQIGVFVGSTRETVSGHLASLIRRQRIRLEGPYYVLLYEDSVTSEYAAPRRA